MGVDATVRVDTDLGVEMDGQTCWEKMSLGIDTTRPPGGPGDTEGQEVQEIVERPGGITWQTRISGPISRRILAMVSNGSHDPPWFIMGLHGSS